MAAYSGFDIVLLFISYSSKDKAWVCGELLPRLQAGGLRVCIDYRDFRPGAPIVKEMERAVLTSRRTLIVLTLGYLASAWTKFETLLLQTLDPANRDFRLLPVLKTACELPLSIRYLGCVDFVNEPESAWDKLLAALSAPAPVATSAPSRSSTGPVLDTSELEGLRRQLIERCSLSDLKELCFALDVAHENYPQTLGAEVTPLSVGGHAADHNAENADARPDRIHLRCLYLPRTG